MSKILKAFNEIDERYINSALECSSYKVKRKIAGTFAACLSLFLCLGLAINILINYNAERPMRIYSPGEIMQTRWGHITYNYYTDTEVCISVVNGLKEDLIIDVSFSGYKYFSEIDKYKNESRIIAHIGYPKEYGNSIVLDDMITVYIDGNISYDYIIPADGKEHEVILEYGRFREEVNKVDIFFYIWGFCCIMQ